MKRRRGAVGCFWCIIAPVSLWPDFNPKTRKFDYCYYFIICFVSSCCFYRENGNNKPIGIVTRHKCAVHTCPAYFLLFGVHALCGDTAPNNKMHRIVRSSSSSHSHIICRDPCWLQTQSVVTKRIDAGRADVSGEVHAKTMRTCSLLSMCVCTADIESNTG